MRNFRDQIWRPLKFCSLAKANTSASRRPNSYRPSIWYAYNKRSVIVDPPDQSHSWPKVSRGLQSNEIAPPSRWRLGIAEQRNLKMAMWRFYHVIAGMKVKEPPSHLKPMCSGLDNYHTRYIQTSSVEPRNMSVLAAWSCRISRSPQGGAAPPGAPAAREGRRRSLIACRNRTELPSI